MANQPRKDNPHHSVRVDNELWYAAKAKAKELGIPLAVPIREALRALVRGEYQPPNKEGKS